jgi:hypothetical protein
MAIVLGQKRAIARIRVGGSRGTGFLVSDDGLLLTAFHVVGDLAKKTLRAGPITIDFGDPREEPNGAPYFSTTAAVVPGCHNAENDWALLQCANAPPNVVPFTCAPLKNSYELAWDTFGFSDAAPDNGIVYAGEVRSVGRRFQLYSDEASAANTARIRGLSGSPCIVHGYVVGILQTANLQKNAAGEWEAQEGAVFVLALTEVERACARVKVTRPVPPFVREVGQLLRPAAEILSAAADVLAIPDPEGKPVDVLRSQVALEMMRSGVEQTRDALAALVLALEWKSLEQILEFAASLWIHDEAAAKLASAGRIVCLNAMNAVTGQRYVHRAGYPIAKHPGWRTFTRVIPNVMPEEQGPMLVGAVQKVLAQMFKCDIADVGQSLDAHPHEGHPIVIVIPPPVPLPPDLKIVKDAFPKLRFALLAGETIANGFQTEYPDVEVVEPVIAKGQEALAIEAHVRAKALVSLSFDNRFVTKE